MHVAAVMLRPWPKRHSPPVVLQLRLQLLHFVACAAADTVSPPWLGDLGNSVTRGGCSSSSSSSANTAQHRLVDPSFGSLTTRAAAAALPCLQSREISRAAAGNTCQCCSASKQTSCHCCFLPCLSARACCRALCMISFFFTSTMRLAACSR